MKCALLASVIAACLLTGLSYNGDPAHELACPDDCDCHYFRVNFVTDCSDSNLTEIPYDELDPNVYILDMSGNLITELAPFPQGIHLRRLQLADNKLTSIKKESFAELKYLIDVDLSGNYITRIDPHAFEESDGLINLELQNNPLQVVNGPFLHLRHLLYLDLSNCGIMYLNPEFFVHIPHLTTLILSDNPLKLIEASVLDPLQNLQTLKLDNCELKHIVDSAFMNQRNLNQLVLSGNNLKHIDWTSILHSLVRLEYLDLSNAHVDHLPENAFDHCIRLRTLILAGNELKDLNVATTLGHNLRHLDSLDLSDCNLNGPFSDDTFANATKLRVLHLSGNRLSDSDLKVALFPLTQLQSLILRNCSLRQLPDVFGSFGDTLKELDVSLNPLSDAKIDTLAPLQNLEYLNMANSNLTLIPAHTFSKMSSMKRLVLSGNDLHNLETGLFKNLTHLESLELNHCGLMRPLNATLFFNYLTYTDLVELQLSGNPLHVRHEGPLLPKQLSRLKVLDISDCNITVLPPDAFSTTRNITTLNLAGNRLTMDNLQFLNQLDQLEELDIRHNNISSLSPKEHLANNPKIKSLKLIGNPWKCTCHLAELWDWAYLEMRNIGMLHGSTTLEENIKVKGTRRKQDALTCLYSESEMPRSINKTPAGRKSFKNPLRVLTAVNRTWAKYVRESGCELPEGFAKRLTRSVDPRATSSAKSYNTPGPNTWILAAINTGIVYGILLVILAIFWCIPERKEKKQN